MKNGSKLKGKLGTAVVRLEDLAPREDVHGGAGKLRFGERRDECPGEDREQHGRALPLVSREHGSA